MVVLNDRLSPDVVSMLWMKGQVFHRARAFESSGMIINFYWTFELRKFNLAPRSPLFLSRRRKTEDPGKEEGRNFTEQSQTKSIKINVIFEDPEFEDCDWALLLPFGSSLGCPGTSLGGWKVEMVSTAEAFKGGGGGRFWPFLGGSCIEDFTGWEQAPCVCTFSTFSFWNLELPLTSFCAACSCFNKRSLASSCFSSFLRCAINFSLAWRSSSFSSDRGESGLEPSLVLPLVTLTSPLTSPLFFLLLSKEDSFSHSIVSYFYFIE